MLSFSLGENPFARRTGGKLRDRMAAARARRGADAILLRRVGQARFRIVEMFGQLHLASDVEENVGFTFLDRLLVANRYAAVVEMIPRVCNGAQ